MNEFDIINTYFAPLSSDGLNNDGAILDVPNGKKLVVTTDTIIRDVHFLARTPAHLIAQKALRTNLSDLAAMGATPLSYSLALSVEWDVMDGWIADFAAGLKADQETYGITLLGGDMTDIHGPEVITITAHGLVDASPLMRSGTQAGDDVYVTGTIGDSALGLHCAQNTIENAFLIDRYQLPQPRLNIGQKLHNIASACLDISDGLLQDAGHIAEQSNIGITIKAANIPLSSAASSLIETDSALAQKIYAGGDDYELLFTAAPNQTDTITALAQETGVPITRIGKCIAGSDVILLNENGDNMTPDAKGWQHF